MRFESGMTIIDTRCMRLRVTEYRKASGMSQLDLALASGLGQSAVSRIENMTRGVRLDHLEAVAKVFGVPVKELIIEDDDEDDDFVAFYKVFSRLPHATRMNLQSLASQMLPDA
ncbi:MAG: helix-turn-helix transcriptional regulator [Pseudomonadota bacterium]